MSDDSGRVPPSLTRLPHRIRFFASTAPSAEKATVLTPAVNGLKSPSNGVSRQENRPTYSTEISPSLLEQQVTPPAVTAIEVQAQRRNPNAVWKPGTFGFDSTADAAGTFQERMTIPMMVLKNIAAQQGQPAPTLQSEVSGAAGAAALVGVGNIGATVLKYISNLIIQRGFGAGLFGLYSISMSVVTLVAAIFNLGLDDAMVRYTSIYRGKRQSRSLLGLTIFCTAITGVMGILGALVVMFAAPAFAALKHSPGAVPLLQVMSPLIPFLCLQAIWSGGLQGFKAFKWRVLSQRIIPAITLIFLLIGVFVLFRDNHRNRLLIGVALATLISTFVGVVLELYFLFRMISRVSKPEPESYELREWLGFATPNVLTAIVDTVLESVDTLLLATFAVSNVAIGQYSAALKISTFIAVPLLSLNAMFAPTIAELHSKGEMQKLTAMFKTVTKWSITLSLPIFIIATLFSVPLLGISGASFIPAWPLLVALSLGSLANIATGSVGNMLLMTGHQKLSFLNSLAAVLVNLVLGIILTPHFGAMGTAISTGLAYGVVNLMRLLQVRVLLKIQPYHLDVLKPIGAGAISAAVTGGVLYLLSYLKLSLQIGHSDISAQLLLIPAFLVLYAWLLSLFKLGPDDQIVVDKFRRKMMPGKNKKKR